jgi:hypothetical protein
MSVVYENFTKFVNSQGKHIWFAMKTLFALLSASTLAYGAIADFEPATQIKLPEPIEYNYKSPMGAALLSTLFPGLGQAYIGDLSSAGTLSGSTCLGMGLFFSPNIDLSVRFNSLVTANNIWSYGVYAAYRDARIGNRGMVYSYKMPTDTQRKFKITKGGKKHGDRLTVTL